jgi:MYXO-CTERM domain-containing protein
MKRLSILCAIALMGSAMAVAQDQTQPQRPADNTARTEQYGTRGDGGGGGNWGWLGLLGLLGLAGLRRGSGQVDRTYYNDTTRRDETIGRRAA